jgi:NAD-dependent deacetylase
MGDAQTYDHAVALIADAGHTLALTGAGISAESGIPTFRETQTGLWVRFSPRDLATPEAFAADPERVWA